MIAAAALLLLAQSGANPVTFWIEPCTKPATGCQTGDVELARWALDAWARAAGTRLVWAAASEERKARIRIYWASGDSGLYGEARPLLVNGERGAEVYVRPDVKQLGPGIAARGREDALFRHTIVYLTCVHETGHALGLPHTKDFDDIMYSFQFGGDFVEYFARFRRKLATRNDIQRHTAISAADQKRLVEALAAK